MPDIVTLYLSADVYHPANDPSDAAAAVMLGSDGPYEIAVSADDRMGQIQAYAFTTDWRGIDRTVTTTFLNDAYGGSASTDRNLLVHKISLNGTDHAVEVALCSTGQSCKVAFPPPVVTGPALSASPIAVPSDEPELGLALTYTPGVLTVHAADGSTTALTGSLTLPPPVLPAGVVANSLPVVTVAPGTLYPDPATGLLALKDGGTLLLADGVWPVFHIDVAQFPSGATVKSLSGKPYKCYIDGQGGVGAGHRLSWGKGGIHTNAPGVVIDGIGARNCGGADRKGDGEAGFYSEASGAFTTQNCAMDGNENGEFAQASVSVFTRHNNDYGLVTPNGQSLDGASHDTYSSAQTTVSTNCRNYSCTNGHGLKSRSLNVTTQGNYFAADGGRWVDLPDGTATAWQSTGDSFTDLPNASTNMIGYADETTKNGSAGAVITNATIAISRFDAVIWCAAGTLQFVSPTLSAFGSGGPSLTLQGSVTGLPALPPPTGTGLPVPPSPLI